MYPCLGGSSTLTKLTEEGKVRCSGDRGRSPVAIEGFLVDPAWIRSQELLNRDLQKLESDPVSRYFSWEKAMGLTLEASIRSQA